MSKIKCPLMNIFLFLGLVTVSAWIDHTDDHYLNYDPYPPFAQFLGWGIELFSVSIVFFYGIYGIYESGIGIPPRVNDFNPFSEKIGFTHSKALKFQYSGTV